ncbi:MAG: ATPase [Gammaproteobacteria bacterium]|nr:ATPase [Gammaproteobacteria bacterium]
MDDTLRHLLEAEEKAEAIVYEGEQKRDEITQKAITESQAAEAQFKARIPELHESFMEKIRERAEQTTAELHLSYDERNKNLRKLAQIHEKEAISRAFQVLLSDGE